MKLENKNNKILDDLNTRNENWKKLDGIPEKVSGTDLKVAKVERELDQFSDTVSNINTNQEAKQSVSGYGVIDLPKTTGEGVGKFSLKGLTATNLVENGDFRDGTNGWGSAYSTNSVENGVLINQATGSSRFPDVRLILSQQWTDDSYYFKTKLKAKTLVGNSHLVWLRGDRGDRITLTNDEQITNEWGIISGLVNRTNQEGNFMIDLKHTYDSVEDAKDQILEVDTVQLINLTQTFGTGNEPTKEQCDLIFSDYFEGTQSTQGAMRVKSVSQDLSKETTQYLPNVGELRSLPNGVSDEIVNGELVKKVSDEVILDGSESWNTPFDLGAVYRSTLTITIPSTIDGGYLTNTYVKINNTDYPRVANYSVNAEHHYGDATKIHVFIDKSKIDTMTGSTITNKFKAYLNQYPITLTYQLSTPIITPINVSGNLISYPSGTIYVEQVVADAGLYTNKMDILNTDLPIKTLDKLSKVDYTTGLEHSLDVSKAVVTAQSFTHPDLTMGDIVFFEYYYDLESTNGNASVEYYDSRYTITDSVTDKIYKWTIAIADGVPSIEIEEV